MRWISPAAALTVLGVAAALVQLLFAHSAARVRALDGSLADRTDTRLPFLVPVGIPFPVISGKADQTNPAVAYDSRQNRYLIVWQDAGDDAGNVYGQLIEGNGERRPTSFPISTASGLQGDPAVAYNAQLGQYLVVWHDFRHGETSGWDVYAQAVSADGELLDDTGRPGANPAFNTPIAHTEGDQFGPVVAFDSHRARFLVVWENDLVIQDEEGNVVGYDRHIYGRLVSGMGQPVGESFVISSGSGDHSFPALAYNANRGQFLTVWQRQDIWLTAQLLDEEGQLVGPRLTITTGSFRAYPVPVPQVTHNDERDEYLVVWDTETTTVDFTEGDVYGRRLDGEGAPLEREPFVVSTAPQEQFQPSLGRHRYRSGYLVTWADGRSRTAQGYDMYGQFLSDDGVVLNEAGTPVAGMAAVNIPLSLAAGDQISPTLAYNGRQNEYLLVWQDGRDLGRMGWEIYGQRYVAGAIGPTTTATWTPSPTSTASPTSTPTPTPSPTPTPTPVRLYVPVFPANAPPRWSIYFPLVENWRPAGGE